MEVYMKRLTILLLLATAAGCGSKANDVPMPPQDTTYTMHSTYDPNLKANLSSTHEAQVYAELWRVCKERHLRYQVSSVLVVGHTEYIASVWNDEFDFWSVYGKGPTEAVEKLLVRLRGEPTTPHQGKVFDTGEVTPQ
jgi:predicted small lipoprotein YifL